MSHPTIRLLVRTVLVLLVAGPALLGPARADDEPTARERFASELAAVYDYLPADVTQEVRDAKVAEMKRFWKFVAADTKTYLPLLREALRDEKANRYFLYDGSGLLVENSEEPADWQLAADATARCRMDDVGRGYFWFCHHLAKHGANAVPAILQMLDDPEFRVIVHRHALELQASDCIRICLFAVGEDRWVAPVIERLRAECVRTPAAPRAVAALMRALEFAVTPEADTFLRELASDETVDPAYRMAGSIVVGRIDASREVGTDAKRSRKEFVAWLAKADQAGRLPGDALEPGNRWDALCLVEASDAPRLRSLRRKTAGRVSDEAMLETQFLTDLLRQVAPPPR